MGKFASLSDRRGASTHSPNSLSRRPHRLERSLYRLRCRSWFRGKNFTTDWASNQFAVWYRVLSPLRNKPLRILEIGSWEGRSAIFFLNFFARATIACIDTFQGNSEEQQYQHMRSGLAGVEQRFDQNLAEFGTRVEKIASSSSAALRQLAAQRRQFDLAYIDGDHRRDQVMADSLGVWQVLAPGGIIIWDDYSWGSDRPAAERPQPAIDAFLAQHEGGYRMLARTEQVIIERLC